MGCDGCELWPTRIMLRLAARDYLNSIFPELAVAAIAQTLNAIDWEKTPTHLYHARHQIAEKLLAQLRPALRLPLPKAAGELARAMAAKYVCYAGILHLRRGGDHTQPHKNVNSGYAPTFEEVKKFPGRIATAAKWSDLSGTSRASAPWRDGLPRLIFLSDMSDLLSRAIDFEYIRDEVITNVLSLHGRRHIWLWLSKRPGRMAEFGKWLAASGLPWPRNLVAMTSLTDAGTVGRVKKLTNVMGALRGLSVEPLYSAVRLPLQGIAWVIIGGASGGAAAHPFELGWARDIMKQCKDAGVACFIKQLGANVVDRGSPVSLRDPQGGDWDEWPLDLRMREFPVQFRGLPLP